MAAEAKRGWIDRLALRAAGVKASNPNPAPTADADVDDGLTRARVLKLAGAAGLAALVPWQLRGGSAQAAGDCLEPCIGAVDAAQRRAMRKCTQRGLPELVLAGWSTSAFCLYFATGEYAEARRECFKQGCGDYGNTIRKGGHIGAFPVAPLELPPGTTSQCEICTKVGGYCGDCPQGTGPQNGFFCGTAGVPPCRYCGGC